MKKPCVFCFGPHWCKYAGPCPSDWLTIASVIYLKGGGAVLLAAFVLFGSLA